VGSQQSSVVSATQNDALTPAEAVGPSEVASMAVDREDEREVQVVQGPSTSNGVAPQCISETTGSSMGILYAAPTVPRKAHSAFSELCSAALQRVAATAPAGGEAAREAQQELLMLPFRLLRNTNGSRRRSSAVHTSIRKYLQGEVPDLQHTSASQRNTAAWSMSKRLHRSLQLSNISRAARMLEGGSLAAPTAGVMAQLAALHPQAPMPSAHTTTVVPLQISRASIRKVISSLPKGSAPGPSGWTFEHIQAVAQGSAAGMDAVLSFVNVLLAGDLPDWPDLRACRLVPLEKGGGKVRPIAVGEVWLRLAAKCAMVECSAIGRQLAPLQMGVGTPGGAHCMGHAFQSGLHAHPGDVTLQLDCKNAFNTVSRQHMLAAVAQEAPQLLPLAQWMYCKPSALLVPNAPLDAPTIQSSSGVRQGDPCGPLFFALTVQPMLQSVQQCFAEVRVIAYLDDVVLQGPYEEVKSAYSELRSQLDAAGLHIQRAKSLVYSPDPALAADLAFQLGFQHAVDGLVVAGCPVGAPEFVAAKTLAAAEGVQQLILTLMGLQVPVQDKLLLLRKSLQVKLAHFARCAPYELAASALQQTEAAVLAAFLALIGRKEDDLDIEQLYLPLRKGGVGLLELTAHQGVVSKAGYLAAAALAQSAMEGGAPAFQPFHQDRIASLSSSWEQVAAFLGGPEQHEEPRPVSLQEALARDFLQQLQRRANGVAQDTRHAQLLGKYRAMLGDDATRAFAQEHLARLHSLECGVGTCWLEVKPTKDQWELDDATVKSALRFMLGLSPGPPHQACFQCACGYKGRDGHHAMSCEKLQGSRIMRHNYVQSLVQCGAAMAGHSSSIEPQERHLKDLRFGDVGYGQRGDVLVSTLDDLLNVDIVVTHPASYSMRSRASREPGAAAKVAEAKKRSTHGVGAVGHTFVPFALESYGRLGLDALKLLRDWADAASGGGLFDRDGYLVWIKREISVALIKGNARLFRQYVGFLTQGVGQRFVQGADLSGVEI
jgi:hypothetical protein